MGRPYEEGDRGIGGAEGPWGIVRFIFRPRVDFLCWDVRLFLSETVSFSPRDLPPTGSARSFFVVPVAFFCPRSRSLGITPSILRSCSFLLCFAEACAERPGSSNLIY